MRCRYTTGTGYSACYRNYIPQMWCRYAKMRRVWIAGVITKGEYKSVMAFRLTGQDKRAKQESNAAAAISFIFFSAKCSCADIRKKEESPYYSRWTAAYGGFAVVQHAPYNIVSICRCSCRHRVRNPFDALYSTRRRISGRASKARGVYRGL